MKRDCRSRLFSLIEHSMILFFFVMILNVPSLEAQTLQIEFNYLSKEKKFEAQRKTAKLRHGKSYRVVLNSIHGGFQKTKVDITQFQQTSEAPAALSFFGIPNTELLPKDVINYKQFSSTSYALTEIASYTADIISLEKCKIETDMLHESILANWRKLDTSALASDKEKTTQILKKIKFAKDKKSFGIFLQKGYILKATFEHYLSDTLVDEHEEVLSKYSAFLYYLQSLEANQGQYLRMLDFLHQIKDYKPQYDSLEVKTFSVKKDKTEIDINLIDAYRNDTLLKQKIELYSHGYVKFDFSTGFFYNSLKDYSVFAEEIEGDTTKVRLRKDVKSDVDIAIGAQFHATYKCRDNFGLGLNIGAGVSPFDGHTRYLFGGHAMFGKAKQLFLSVGVAIANVKRFSDQGPDNSLGDDGIIVDKQFAEPRLVNKIDHSIFIGLSYNLGSIFK